MYKIKISIRYSYEFTYNPEIDQNDSMKVAEFSKTLTLPFYPTKGLIIKTSDSLEGPCAMIELNNLYWDDYQQLFINNIEVVLNAGTALDYVIVRHKYWD